jgi:putative peptidoglycan lipid II flippase
MAAVQINSAIDPLFATFATIEGPAYLWYALRLQQLPLALVALALSSALLPSLSTLLEHHDHQGYKDQLKYGISRALFFMIPITALTLILAPLAINLLFGHGAFTSLAVIQSSYALFAYILGIIPMTLTQLFSIALFASKSYKIPAIASTLSVILSLLLNTLFIFYCELGAYSVAHSTSLSALFNALLLYYYLPYKPSFPCKELLPTLLATTIATTITLFIEPISWNLVQGITQIFPSELLVQIQAFTLPLLLFSALFFGSLKAIAYVFPQPQTPSL